MALMSTGSRQEGRGAKTGCVRCATLLLGSGGAEAADGAAALAYATRCGELAAAQLLHGRGVSAFAPERRGWLPLRSARLRRRAGVARLLLQRVSAGGGSSRSGDCRCTARPPEDAWTWRAFIEESCSVEPISRRQRGPYYTLGLPCEFPVQMRQYLSP